MRTWNQVSYDPRRYGRKFLQLRTEAGKIQAPVSEKAIKLSAD